eukprot:g6541.t1
MHVQLQPLEVLWLHGLFAATTVPSTLQLDSGLSCTEASALTTQPPRQQVLPLFESMEPSLVPTRELVVLDPNQPSSSIQRQPLVDSTQSHDPYTQSIKELYQFLQNYDDSSNKTNVDDIPPQEATGQLTISPEVSMGEIDLTCNERLDDTLDS